MKNNKLLKSNPIRWMTETAMMLSIFIILGVISRYSSMMLWPQGGSIGINFIIIVICFYRLGFWSPLIVWFFGIIISSAFTGFFIINPWQFILDYCFPLFALIFGAFMIYFIKNIYWSILIFSLSSCIINFIFAVVSGALFFSQYAPVGQGAIIYSLIYNVTYMIPSYCLSAGILLIFFPLFKRFFILKNMY